MGKPEGKRPLDTEISGVKLGVTISTFFPIYRAPSGNFTNFLLKLENILQHFMNPNTEFIISGDININYLADTLGKVTELITHFI